jgi:dynein heavy chain
MDKILAHLVPEGKPAVEDCHIRSLFFGNYMEPDADPKIYDEVNQSEILNYTKYQVSKSLLYLVMDLITFAHHILTSIYI